MFILHWAEYYWADFNSIKILKALRAYTLKGKIICYIIVGLCKIASIFIGKKWAKPLDFEENPRTMRFKDILYFAYKYYYKPALKPLNKEIGNHFNGLSLNNQLNNIENSTTQITLSIGGDLMPYEMIKPQNTHHLWDNVGADFFGSDIVFANLETPLDSRKKPSFVPEVMLSNMLFNTDEQTFDIFSGNGQYKGYDVLSVANNHSLDMGENGLIETMKFLDSKNIVSVGAAYNLEDFNTPKIIEKNGIKVGFIAYTYSLNQFLPPADKPWLINYLPLNTSNCDIQIIKQQAINCKNAGADVIVCSLHCGNAYQAFPNQSTINLFEKIFTECGVDIIAGGHPHNLQPWQNYEFICPFTQKRKQGFAIYSLADFIAYDIFTWCHLSAYLKVGISKNKNQEIEVSVEVKPIILHKEKEQLHLFYAHQYFENKLIYTEKEDLKLLYNAITK